MTHKFETWIDFPLQIGESPVWDEERGVLWFVDIPKPAIYCLDPHSRRVSTHIMPSLIASLGIAAHGKLIIAMRNGIHLWDPSTGRLEYMVHPEPELHVNRLNDGKVGPDGCFWVGSMHDAIPREPTGNLYRITPEGSCTKILSGLRVSNGLAWSPDGKTMYHSDSRGPYIQLFDFDPATGAVSNGRTFAEPDVSAGLPDGGAIDLDGVYWSAGITAGVLNRFAPDGKLLEVIELPVAAPTMPCFGGTDMRTMFITSLTGQGTGRRYEGTLSSMRVEVPGTPVDIFGQPRSISRRNQSLQQAVGS